MCEPVHFRIAYEINPWMRRSNQVDGERALEQWRRLHAALVELGVEVELVEQAPDVPDMTFTANAGVAVGRRYFPANFRFPERQPEEARFSIWFVLSGYTVEAIHRAHHWEGEGDVLPQGGTVFAGHRFRTEEACAGPPRRAAAHGGGAAGADRSALLPPRHGVLPSAGRRRALRPHRLR
jgi:N-dimethylarginine dimethylaminohydrolase